MAKSSLDSVLGGRNLENIIRLLHDDGIEYIEETVGGMSLLERQIFFVNCIKVIDKSYYDYVMTKSDESATFFFDILKYAYPVLIKYLWTKDFETLMATPLARADSDDIYRCRVFLCSCRIVGQAEYILQRLKLLDIWEMVSKEKILINLKFFSLFLDGTMEIIQAKN